MTWSWLSHQWKNLHTEKGDLCFLLSRQKRQRGRNYLAVTFCSLKFILPGTSIASWPSWQCQSLSIHRHASSCIFSRLRSHWRYRSLCSLSASFPICLTKVFRNELIHQRSLKTFSHKLLYIEWNSTLVSHTRICRAI